MMRSFLASSRYWPTLLERVASQLVLQRKSTDSLASLNRSPMVLPRNSRAAMRPE
ncbi:MAG: hypothetical protein U0794_08590 [Isosphaeraceae bacterium]